MMGRCGDFQVFQVTEAVEDTFGDVSRNLFNVSYINYKKIIIRL